MKRNDIDWDFLVFFGFGALVVIVVIIADLIAKLHGTTL